MHTPRGSLKALKTLRRRDDYIKIQNSGLKWVSDGLILQVRENNLGHVRVGFTVSKKVHKSAVKRNRIKRRLRAVAADVLSQHASGNCDYVLVGRTETAHRPYDNLCKDLQWCMKRTGFIKIAAEV